MFLYSWKAQNILVSQLLNYIITLRNNDLSRAASEIHNWPFLSLKER